MTAGSFRDEIGTKGAREQRTGLVHGVLWPNLSHNDRSGVEMGTIAT